MYLKTRGAVWRRKIVYFYGDVEDFSHGHGQVRRFYIQDGVVRGI
jgi:hypothetical protein